MLIHPIGMTGRDHGKVSLKKEGISRWKKAGERSR
jgi:hypothetical protein